MTRLAVDLGCERVYLFDSAAVYEDIFIWLARLAEQTDARLGAAVLVPNLRHVMTTASAIATLEDLAPGRFVYGFGTGAVGAHGAGQEGAFARDHAPYVEQLRALLPRRRRRDRGRAHADDPLARPRADTPDRGAVAMVSAFGPKGARRSRTEIADGVMTVSDDPVGMAWNVRMVNGTILDPGED